MAYEQLQSLIDQQGLTADQAMKKYSVGQETIDGLSKQGVTFANGASAAPAAAPYANFAAQLDALRNGTPSSEVFANGMAGGSFTPAAGTTFGANRDAMYDHWAIDQNRNYAQEQLDKAFGAGNSPYLTYDQRTAAQTRPGATASGNATHLVRDPATGQMVPAPGTYGSAGGVASPPAGGLMDAASPREKHRDSKKSGAVSPPIASTPAPASSAPAAVGGGSSYTANGYTATAPAPQPAGGTALPAQEGMAGYTVPNASLASVGDIGVSTATNANPIAATPAQASSYTATDGTASQWTPDGKSTVQGQLKDIIAEGSPLMDMAQTRALQRANASGLRNSSMAVQAGQAALYDSAMPIAQQDASTFAQAGQFNAQNQTQVSMANAAARNAAEQFKAQTATDVSKFNSDALLKAGAINQEQANKISMFNSSEANKSLQFELQTDADIQKFNASESNALLKLGMDSQTKMALANIEATYKTLMQSSASSAEVYKTLIGNVGSILGNKDMDAAAKAAAIGNLVGITNGALGVVGDIANLDLPELDFSDLPASAVAEAPNPTPAPTPAPAPADGGQDANGSVAGGTAGDGVGNNANGDAAGVGAGPI